MADEKNFGIGQHFQTVRSTQKQDFSKHKLRKRQPPRLPKRANDVYVTNKTNFQAQLTKCQQLFQNGEKEIVIHGLGAAVNRAINLGLTLQDKLSHTVEIAVNTSSVNLVDEFEPVNNSDDFGYRYRSNSAVHIRVYRVKGFGETPED